MFLNSCFILPKKWLKYDFRIQTTVSIFDENKFGYLELDLLSKDVDLILWITCFYLVWLIEKNYRMLSNCSKVLLNVD